ncbi:MAG: hypothetical protein K6346_00340 [Halothiobacillaceae bacterium]
MSCGCGTSPNPDGPILALTLVGQGEPLIRMGKRLECAARGAGIRLDLTIVKDHEGLGIPYADTPCVLHEGAVLTRGLVQAERLEQLMKELMPPLRREENPIKP